MSFQLSSNAIVNMKHIQHGIMENYVVQVIQMKNIKGNYLKFEMFDGEEKFKGMYAIKEKQQLSSKLFLSIDIQLKDFAIIRIIQHLTHEKNGIPLAIEVVDYKIIANCKELYQPGNNYNELKNVKQEYQELKKIKFEENPSKTPSKPIQPVQPILPSAQIQTIRPISSTKKNSIIDYENQLEDILETQIKRFQNLLDLYVDMPGWQILIRVVDKSYREFMSRGNKLTKIFTMEIIDRLGWKTQATMFGEDAKEYYQLIKIDFCYRISRGQIREETIYSKRGGKNTKTTIMLSKNTCFVPCKDVKAIPKNQNSVVTLGQLLKNFDIDTIYDVIGILTDIREEREIQKDAKTIIKQSFFISDPEIMKTVEVVIWNRVLKIDESMKNKTVLLKQFKMNTYRDMLNLNSLFKSEIALKTNHRFNKVENSFKANQCQEISNIGGKKDDKSTNDKDSKIKRNLKQLQQECYHLEIGETLTSELDLWLNHMSFRGKWFYESCPKCKKTATAFQICHQCSTKVQQTAIRYILPIQMSDFCGSLWTTAFDELAINIFRGIPASTLKQLDEMELKEQAQKRLYQEYKVKIMTKKEENGGLKHTIIGKVSQINFVKKAKINVERIKRSI